VAALGYKFVDADGNHNTMEARQMTYYAPDPDRAVCIEFIYRAIAYEGYSSYQLMVELDERAKADRRFAAPKARQWNGRTLVKLIRNPLYKGEYVASRRTRKESPKWTSAAGSEPS
jgi:hypothetical protein